MSLKYDEKPNYNLIKLWLATDLQDEKRVFDTQHQIKNKKIAKDILYQNDQYKENNKEEEKVCIQP